MVMLQKASSSGVSSPASAGSPRSVVGDYSLEDMPITWDNDHQIRARLRGNGNLLMRFNTETAKEEVGFVEATNDNCKVNAAVLRPVLKELEKHDLQLPSVPALQASIESFYLLSKVVRSSEQVYQEAWGIRRLIGKTKKFCYRDFPPQDYNGSALCNINFYSIAVQHIYMFIL